MPQQIFKQASGEQPVALTQAGRLSHLAKLAVADIETPLVMELSDSLHAIFDPVSSATLPIYFGPLLGRLYLEGL